jgi:hypothetical protein
MKKRNIFILVILIYVLLATTTFDNDKKTVVVNSLIEVTFNGKNLIETTIK